MLLFYPVPPALNLDTVWTQGLRNANDAPVHLHVSLDAAQQETDGPILVVDATALPSVPSDPITRDGLVQVSHVPSAAVQNLDPYRPPHPVAAGGGYVTRSLPEDIAVLLIHRRGVWDLPKGHQDPGEDLETCALREVKEEVGIKTLHLRRPLGTTQHGYPDGDMYAVKTTYWYLMQTPERSFSPEQNEGIRRVAWARWSVASQHIGYETLRRHMAHVESAVRTALG
ncbi:hypothetical protein BSZ35_07425 [Salinibacter sp. 10B]|uniref:NUDIX hydrolase n=1 Tax=Salinibacter sp. 10B TaxID=1923971 RepID=UPI000CF50C78|nr:NUDIX hydrolase [Salinibacter sp. 10B]PQJ34454.1 hypothetical protein BSZ35_07425 [Salinibacter sp. 10B]